MNLFSWLGNHCGFTQLERKSMRRIYNIYILSSWWKYKMFELRDKNLIRSDSQELPAWSGLNLLSLLNDYWALSGP